MQHPLHKRSTIFCKKSFQTSGKVYWGHNAFLNFFKVRFLIPARDTHIKILHSNFRDTIDEDSAKQVSIWCLCHDASDPDDTRCRPWSRRFSTSPPCSTPAPTPWSMACITSLKTQPERTDWGGCVFLYVTQNNNDRLNVSCWCNYRDKEQ